MCSSVFSELFVWKFCTAKTKLGPLRFITVGYIAGVRAPDVCKQGHGCLSIVSLGISREPTAFQTSIHAARTSGEHLPRARLFSRVARTSRRPPFRPSAAHVRQQFHRPRRRAVRFRKRTCIHDLRSLADSITPSPLSASRLQSRVSTKQTRRYRPRGCS